MVYWGYNPFPNHVLTSCGFHVKNFRSFWGFIRITGNNPITQNHRNTPNPIQTLHYSSTLENTPSVKNLAIFGNNHFQDFSMLQISLAIPPFTRNMSNSTYCPRLFPWEIFELQFFVVHLKFRRQVAMMPVLLECLSKGCFFFLGGSKKTMVILFGVGRNKQQKRAARSQTLSWQLVKLLSHVPGSTQPGLD